MARLKEKGDLAELKVACELMERGWGIAVPWGENCDFDLVAYRGGELHRVQVKYTESNGRVVVVRCGSCSLTNGKVKRRKRYTAAMIDWIAVYDRQSDCCYYVPAVDLGEGRTHLHLRLTPALNSQRIGIRFADDYREFGRKRPLVAGLLAD